jgi:hypothetical protein
MVDLLLRAAATIEPQPITAFIDCSPLGLCCHVCKVAFTSNETARNHLKSNHVESFNLWTPKAIRKTFKELRERSCNNSSLDGWLVGELENGGECSVCMQFLPHKRKFKRHKDINEACTSASYNLRIFCWTRCFRRVPVQRKKIHLKGLQVMHGSEGSPLLPPDDFSQACEECYRMGNSFHRLEQVSEARDLFHQLLEHNRNKLTKRKFVVGALYKDLYGGYYKVDTSDLEEVSIEVTVDLGPNQGTQQSTISVFNFSAQIAMVESLQILGLEVENLGPGNCRKGNRDVGSMRAIGIRKRSTGVTFVQSENEKIVVATDSMTSKVRPYLQWHQPTFLESLDTAEEKATKCRKLEWMNGMGSSIMTSLDLGNSAHIDLDNSPSCSFWVEKNPGNARNWRFIFPNVTIDGKNGLVINLFHGCGVVWDGRLLHHCTSITEISDDNHVFACMFGSCRDHNQTGSPKKV